MTEPTYRTYAAGDLGAIVAAWNDSMPADPVTVDWFTEYVLLDVNFDPAGLVLAVSGDRVLGAVYAVRRRVPAVGVWLDPEPGWLPFLFVRPEYRGHGVGSVLVDRALRYLGDSGCRYADVACYTPNYFAPGVDPQAYPDGHAMLGRRGFTVRATATAMDKSLVGFAVPGSVTATIEKRCAEGHRFGPPTQDELPELIAFAAGSLAPDWGEAIREAVLRGLPLTRIVAAWRGDTLLGFAMYGGYRGVAERFGPFGVAEAARNSGVGTILLYLTLHAMRSEGLHTAWFLWTGEDSPAGRLYRRAGFTVTRRFDVMRCTF